jgi:hypothetical protein
VRKRLSRARLRFGEFYRELGGQQYALPPAATGGGVRRLVEPVRRAAGAVQQRLPSVPQPGSRSAAAAVVTVATVAALVVAPVHVPPPPAGSPRDRPNPSVPGTGLTRPRDVVPLPAAARRLAGDRTVPAVGLGLDRLGGSFEEDWENGRRGWRISGSSAGVDCAVAWRGRCSLRLEPEDSVTVSTPTNLHGTALVRMALLPTAGAAEYRLRVRLGTESVDLAITTADRRIRLSSSASGATASTPMAYPDNQWNVVVLGVDLGARTARLGGVVAPERPVQVPIGRGAVGVTGLELTARRSGGAPALAHVDMVTVVHRSECLDGRDNDYDGAIDLADRGCGGGSFAMDREFDASACSDGLDNDGDGLIDFPWDPQCEFRWQDDEEPDCDDGRDNDGDGHADYPDDPHCDRGTESSEAAACADGKDGDGDGRTDFPADLGCDGASDDTELACTTATVQSWDQHRHAGTCLDPREWVGRVGLLGNGLVGDVYGYLDEYAFADGVAVVTCVVLARDSAVTDPCAAAGGRFVKRVATLRAETALAAGHAAADTGFDVCLARLHLVIRTDVVDSGFHVLTPCRSTSEGD